MIKLVNGIPEKFTEMDEKVKFLQQVDQEVGPVILINKFNVDPEEVDEFLKAFAATDKVLKRQPGYISAQLHRGIKGSKGEARATIISEDRQKVISIMEKICSKYLGTLDDPWAKQLIGNAADGTFVGIEIAPKFFSAYVLTKMEEARSIS
jgi:quinol monooxygenase YgiN